MAAELVLVDVNDDSLHGGAEEDAIVYRKNKVSILLSDDDSADKAEKSNSDTPVEGSAKSPIDIDDGELNGGEEKAWNSKKLLSILDSDSEDERIFDPSSNETRDDKQAGTLAEAENEDEKVSTKSNLVSMTKF